MVAAMTTMIVVARTSRRSSSRSGVLVLIVYGTRGSRMPTAAAQAVALINASAVTISVPLRSHCAGTLLATSAPVTTHKESTPLHRSFAHAS